MQEDFNKDKRKYFIEKVGELIKEIRINNKKASINKLANEYDLDKGSLSKIERGQYSIEFLTAWRIIEALGIDFSEFSKQLKEKLGKDFKLMDE